MAFVRTVLGDVEASTSAITNAHEHLAITGGLILVQHPDYRLDDTERAIAGGERLLRGWGKNHC